MSKYKRVSSKKKPGPAPGSGGRPPLPPEKKKEKRVVVYAVPATAEKIKEAGGSPFVSGLVERMLGTKPRTLMENEGKAEL